MDPCRFTNRTSVGFLSESENVGIDSCLPTPYFLLSAASYCLLFFYAHASTSLFNLPFLPSEDFFPCPGDA